MKNEELKKKIVEIIRYCYVNEKDYGYIFDLHIEEKINAIADALIAAEIGDVSEWKERAENFSYAYNDCSNDLAEMEHLAEVAEKALQYAVSEYRCDECPCLDCNAEIRGSQECIDCICEEYKKQAEKKLQKERKDDRNR